ncbi:MAG: DUF4160 domain-containing protein [Gemmatimonadota bacterium]
MSPTIFTTGGLRFFFFSREESRLHVHVSGPSGEAKLWLEPRIEVARNHSMTPNDLRKALRIVEERADEIRTAWREHFWG